ncbi:hypothetical protein [Ralstonia pseudosolanacearum]|uniref:hypothetical protein n=1 Tax=Ralstonia pseudosolanacearum TaxID=1310165 RepID=UPI003CEE6825
MISLFDRDNMPKEFRLLLACGGVFGALILLVTGTAVIQLFWTEPRSLQWAAAWVMFGLAPLLAVWVYLTDPDRDEFLPLFLLSAWGIGTAIAVTVHYGAAGYHEVLGWFQAQSTWGR